jgi:hypothetical protein
MSRVCTALCSMAVLFAPMCATTTVAGSGSSCVVGDNIRAVRPWIDDIVHVLAHRSPTLRRLLTTLRAAPVVIHLDDDLATDAAWDGRIRFVTLAGGCRYLRIDLRRQDDPARSAALLAHELQHAVEIQRAEVADRPSFERLFTRIGFPAAEEGGVAIDTDAAVTAGRRALEELTGRRSGPVRRAAPTRVLRHRR